MAGGFTYAPAPWGEEDMQKSGSPALRWGLIFGGIYAVLGIGETILQQVFVLSKVVDARDVQQVTAVAGPSIGILCGFLFLYLALFFVAGIFAGRQTGSVGSATIAGLLTGLFGDVLSGIFNIIFFSVVH